MRERANLNASQAPTVAVTASQQGGGNRSVVYLKVAEFVYQMGMGKTNAHQLNSRLAASAGPQRTAAGSSASAATNPEDADALELEDLEESGLKDVADAIELGESQINGWDKFVARVKSWLPGRDMSIEIAKQAFCKIDQACQPVILKLAFQTAASSWNSRAISANVQNLLEFCQVANIDANAIIDAIDSITFAGKTKVLAALGQPNSGFNWDCLGTDETKKFILALTKASTAVTTPKPSHSNRWTGDPDLIKAGEQCKQHLKQLTMSGKLDLSSLKTLDSNKAKDFILDLVKTTECYGYRFDLLTGLGFINLGAATFKEFVFTLGKSRYGADYLDHLLTAGALGIQDLDTDTANQIALELSKHNVSCLKHLLAKGVLNLNLDVARKKELVINLTKAGSSGGNDCFKLLLEKGILSDLNLDADLIISMANVSYFYGKQGYLEQWLEKLANNPVGNPPKFEGDAAIQLVQRLGGAKGGASCLKLLLEKNILNLNILANTTAAKELVINLSDAASDDGQGRQNTACLLLLLEKNILNLDILNLEDVNVANKLVINLSKDKWGEAFLWQLIKKNILNLDILNLEDVNVAKAIAITLSDIGKDEPDAAALLKQFLEGGRLHSLNLRGDEANDFILALFNLKEYNVDCLRLFLEKDQKDQKDQLHSLNLEGGEGEFFVEALVGQVEYGGKDQVECLQLLFDFGKLRRLPMLEYRTVEDLCSRLESSPNWGEKECLEKLRDEIKCASQGRSFRSVTYYYDDD
ncbi:MAG: hypothetical protein LBE98_00655 [Puniceicoccales bacterium]|nr:hypothetical protein [Puniceicoccales bacterium]